MNLARLLLGQTPVSIAQAVAGFGAIAAFSRLLTPEDYGRYALILSGSMLAHTAALTWAEAAAYRFLGSARAEGREAHHFATLLAIALAAAIAAAFLCAAALAFLPVGEGRFAAIALAGLGACFRFLSRIARESDRATMEMRRYAPRETGFALAGFALGAAFATTTQLGPAAPFLGVAIAAGVVAAGDLAWLLRRARGGSPDIGMAGRFFAYGAPLAAALALELFVQTAARGIIAHTLGEAAVGAYAAAFGITARILDLGFIWLGLAASPLLLAAHESGDRTRLAAMGRQFGGAMLALMAPAAAGIALVSGPLAAIMVGEGLRAEVARIAPWTALSGFAAGMLTHCYAEAFQLARRTGLRALLMLAPAALTLLLTAALAPRFGLVGAAMAASIASVLGAVLLAVAGRRFAPIGVHPADALRIVGATAVMALATLLMPAAGGAAELAAKALVGAFAYGAAAIAFDVPHARAASSAIWTRLQGRLPQEAEGGAR